MNSFAVVYSLETFVARAHTWLWIEALGFSRCSYCCRRWHGWRVRTHVRVLCILWFCFLSSLLIECTGLGRAECAWCLYCKVGMGMITSTSAFLVLDPALGLSWRRCQVCVAHAPLRIPGLREGQLAMLHLATASLGQAMIISTATIMVVRAFYALMTAFYVSFYLKVSLARHCS